MGLMDMLTQAVGGGSGAQQFGQIAQNAPSDVLAKGLSAAFASDQTPAIGNMVGQLFGQSNGTQQAGMLNQLLGALGPGVMAGLAGGVLGRVMSPGQTQITPEQASQLTPQQEGRRKSPERSAPRCRRPVRSVLRAAPGSHQYARGHRGHRGNDENERSLVRAIVG